MRALALSLMLGLYVQTVLAQKVSFEVATIKPSTPGAVVRIGGSCHGTDSKYYPTEIETPPLGRCVYVNITLSDLLSSTFAATDSNGIRMEVTGGPSWVNSERWEIQGKAEDPSSTKESDLRLMLRQLIIERFQLQFHSETRDAQGFALLIAKNGPKFSEDQRDISPAMFFNGKDARFQNSSLADLAMFLSGPVGAPVMDKTGLRRKYAFEFHIPPRQSGDADSPAIFTALQEQLGLRLDSTKVPVETLIIDKVQKLSDN